jgi:hypothetical protein
LFRFPNTFWQCERRHPDSSTRADRQLSIRRNFLRTAGCCCAAQTIARLDRDPNFGEKTSQTFFLICCFNYWTKYLRILRIAFLLLDGVNDPEVRLFFGRFQRQTVAKSLIFWSVVQLLVFRTVFGGTDGNAWTFEEYFIGRLAGSFALKFS